MLPLAADRLRISLRFTRPARFHFHHGGVLRGLLSFALRRHSLPAGLMPFACELGQVRFEAGDRYRLVVTLIGEDRRFAGPLVGGIRRIGVEERSGGGPLPTLGGNFEVESVEPLPLPDLEASPASHRRDELPLRFLAPLRLERPPELKARGAGYLNQDCFPAGHFLARLWNRLFLVAHGRWPEVEERAGMPPIPGGVEAEPRGLFWLDVPVEGARAKGRSYTLGGVLGSVVLRGLSSDWLPLLSVGRLVHAGADTSFGFGAYEIAGPGPLADRSLAPARHLFEVAGSEAGTPALLDRDVPRAVCAGLGPAVDALLEDCSWAYRNGFSRAGAGRAMRRAREQGYCRVVGAAADSLVETIGWPCLERRLEALFPFEPSLPPLVGWMEAPAAVDGRPSGSALSRLLVKLGVEELGEAMARRGRRLIRRGDGFVILAKERVATPPMPGRSTGPSSEELPGAR